LLNKLKPKSEFSKNVLTLMTGTTIAQAIPIAISPILTRLYTPEDFGVFALFIAITSIFGSIANGRYELAIMLPKKDEDAINILALGFIINVILSLFLLLIVIIFHNYIVKLLNNKEISPWLYFVPFSVFLIGIFNLLNYFNNRMKQYKDLAKANVYKSIGMAAVQLSLGFLKAGVLGLISGQIFSQIISNAKLFFNIKKLKLFDKINKLKMIVVAKKYQNFFKYSIISTLFNSTSNIGMPIIIKIFFAIDVVGFYFFSNKIVRLPISLILSSLSQVYFQKASNLYHINKKELLIFTLKIQFKIAIILAPFLIVFSLIAPYIFEIVFGKEWREAGEYIKYFAVFIFFNSLYSPISSLGDILSKQKLLLFFNLLLIFVQLFIMLLFNNLNFKYVLLIISLISSFLFIVLNLYMLFCLKKEL